MKLLYYYSIKHNANIVNDATLRYPKSCYRTRMNEHCHYLGALSEISNYSGIGFVCCYRGGDSLN